MAPLVGHVALNTLGDAVLAPDMMLLKHAKLSLLAETSGAGLSSLQCWLALGAGAASSGIFLLLIWLVVRLTSSDLPAKNADADALVGEREVEGN